MAVISTYPVFADMPVTDNTPVVLFTVEVVLLLVLVKVQPVCKVNPLYIYICVVNGVVDNGVFGVPVISTGTSPASEDNRGYVRSCKSVIVN